MGVGYVGRLPDSDAVVMPKGTADTTAAAIRVDTDYIAAQVALQITNNALQLPSYVDTQDNLRAKKTAVDAADANYFATTALNAANGVAGLDSSGDLLVAQIPAGIRTDRVATSVTGTNLLASGAVQKVFTTNHRETAIATLTVDDPGYPWRPLCFALAQGASVDGQTPASRAQGNNVFGLLVAMPPVGVSDTIYGATVFTANPHYSYQLMLPYAAAGQTPQSVPPITGGLQLDLYASCYIGSGFTFRGEGLSYWCLVAPAVGG